MTTVNINKSNKRKKKHLGELNQGEFFEWNGKLYYTAIVYQNTDRTEVFCFSERIILSMNRKTENYEVYCVDKVNIEYE